MSMLKEKTISAMDASTLASRDSAVMPVDRIGALARASHLGSDLWHVMNLDAQSLRSAIYRLAKKLRNRDRMAQSMAVKVASQAVIEKYIPQCPQCAGVREVAIEALVLACPACNGFGRRRYSDAERARALGLSVTQFKAGWCKKLDQAISILDGADHDTHRTVRLALTDNE